MKTVPVYFSKSQEVAKFRSPLSPRKVHDIFGNLLEFATLRRQIISFKTAIIQTQQQTLEQVACQVGRCADVTEAGQIL